MTIFAVKWNVVSESLKFYWMIFLQNLMEAGSGIENIMIDRQSGNSSFKYMFFHCFQTEFREEGINYFLNFHYHAYMYQQLLGFMSFILNLTNKIAKIPWKSRNMYVKHHIYKEISENWRSRKNSNESLLV